MATVVVREYIDDTAGTMIVGIDGGAKWEGWMGEEAWLLL